MEEIEGVDCCSKDESKSSGGTRPPNPNPSSHRQCKLVRHASLVSYKIDLFFKCVLC